MKLIRNTRKTARNARPHFIAVSDLRFTTRVIRGILVHFATAATADFGIQNMTKTVSRDLGFSVKFVCSFTEPLLLISLPFLTLSVDVRREDEQEQRRGRRRGGEEENRPPRPSRPPPLPPRRQLHL